MQKKHINIPIFIPHLGCPNDCVFCNQRSISGRLSFDISEVEEQIDEALSTIDPDTSEVEIAFFGGSFTGIDRELMIRLLDIAQKRVDAGLVGSLRCSTRPDYIDDEILDILSGYSMKTIELGIQSISDGVLASSRRGHTSSCSLEAMRLIVSRGFSLVGQMMIGLPSSDLRSELDTAEAICAAGAEGARIYPTVVLRDTELCTMMQDGRYLPMDIDDALERTASVLEVMVKNKVEVIRIGLQSGESLGADNVLGGSYAPALGEMVKNRYYLRLARRLIAEASDLSDGVPAERSLRGSVLALRIPSGSYSKVMGHKSCNRDTLIKEYGFSRITVLEDGALPEYDMKINILREKD